MSTISHDIQIGTRIQVDEDRATVRYIGEVANSTGQWLGVEWDNDTRGKHDGSHKGIRYFSCRSDTSGSFIRYHAKKVLLGCSFLDALTSKYIIDLTQDPNSVYDPTKDSGTVYLGGNKNIEVETVGFGKIQKAQSQLSDLKVVGLSDTKIVSEGKNQVIAKANLSIEDLDLSKNLVNDWKTVANIASQLPQLTILRLNYIRLLPPDNQLLNSSPSPFQHLKTLVLCNTHITWHHILQLEPLLLHLEDLQLSGNGISKLDYSPTQFQQLKCINLEDNCIQDWKQVDHLGSLPNLETLFLNGNHIPSIDLTPDSFKKLAYLRVDRNQLRHWDSFDILDRLPSLVKLRCHENPVFKGIHVEEIAAQVVGRIHGLTTLNGNTLTGRERIDLERFYLKLCTRDGDTQDKIVTKHPRYLDLCRVHGEPDIGPGKNNIGLGMTSTLNQRLITITLSQLPLSTEQDLLQKHQTNDLPAPVHTMTKRVLATMIVRSLRHLIQKLFGVPASRQHLYLIQQPSENEQSSENQQSSQPHSMIMDMADDLRDLKYYSIGQGDHIVVLDY
ncbi:hypothetical protein BC941DRAFT_434548 [Chlamydoabsidia padenii]|nr:hypothetical protein BC941DRAFT_434548 [Chlamydoabsidia padenii]